MRVFKSSLKTHLFNTAYSYLLPVPPAPLKLRHYGALQVYYYYDLPVGRKFHCWDVCFYRVWFGVLTTRSFSKANFLLKYNGGLFYYQLNQ